MRILLRAMLLALAIGPLLPDVAMCQEDDGFNDEPPPPRVFDRPRRTWRSSPIVWGTVGVVTAVALPFGVYKTVMHMRQWQLDQGRPKEPWEIAMEQAERERVK